MYPFSTGDESQLSPHTKIFSQRSWEHVLVGWESQAGASRHSIHHGNSWSTEDQAPQALGVYLAYGSADQQAGQRVSCFSPSEVNQLCGTHPSRHS